MDDEIVAVLQRQHGIIRRTQALDAGMSSRQIERRMSSGTWVREARGVYRHLLMRPSWRSRLLVSCLRYNGVASHRAAAVLHEIEDYRPGRIELVVANGRWSPPADVTLHQSTQMDRTSPIVIDAIPCTGLARTVLDLAAVVGREKLEDTIDAVVRDRRLDLPSLYEVLVAHSRKGRDGCGRLRAALDDRMGGDTIPLSKWSRMVSRLLVKSGLPAPELEWLVRDREGRFLGQVDLAYPRSKVAVELDSVRWHLNRASFEKDPQRRNRLSLTGWTVLNFTWKRYLDDPAGVCREVRTAIHGF